MSKYIALTVLAISLAVYPSCVEQHPAPSTTQVQEEQPEELTRKQRRLLKRAQKKHENGQIDAAMTDLNSILSDSKSRGDELGQFEAEAYLLQSMLLLELKDTAQACATLCKIISYKGLSEERKRLAATLYVADCNATADDCIPAKRYVDIPNPNDDKRTKRRDK